jgi:hypothetical protein
MLGEEAPVWICQKCDRERENELRKTQKGKHDLIIGVFSVEKAIMGRLKAEVKRII